MEFRPKNILVLGATGHTGKLIVSRLNEMGIDFSIGGRSSEKLIDLKNQFPFIVNAEVIEITKNIESLDEYDVIINCVGPFNLWGKSVLDRCIEKSKIYIDITGEQEFVKNSFENCSNVLKSEATVIHSVAFESCLADILISENWVASEEYEDISTYYYFKKAKPSRGTKLTMQLASHFSNFALQQSDLVKTAPSAFTQTVFFQAIPENTIASFMPYPEIVFLKKRNNIKNGASFLLLSEIDSRYLSASSSSKVPIDELILKHNRSSLVELSLEEKQKQEFILILRVTNSQGIITTKTIKGCDMYGLTAMIVANLIKRINRGAILPKGVILPSEAFGSEWNWKELNIEQIN